MAVIEWEGIPRAYWPDTARPWRVTWGFGAFKDFRTKREAQKFAVEMRKDWGDDICAPSDPFNAVKRKVEA